MKTKQHLLAVLGLIISIAAGAQTESALSDSVTLDFKTGKITNLDLLKNLEDGDFYTLKITNINETLYEVALNHSDSTVQSKQSMPDFGGINLDALSKLIGGIGPFQTLSGIVPVIMSSQKNATEKAKEVNEYFKLHNESYELWDDGPITSLAVDEEAIKLRMQSEKKELEAFKQEITDVKIKIDDFYLAVNKATLTSYQEFGPYDTSYDFGKAWEEIELLRNDIKDLMTRVKSAHQDYNQFSGVEKNESIIASDDELKKADSGIKGAYGELVKLCDQLLESVNASKSKELLTSVVLHNNNASMTYKSMPMQFHGNEGSLKINIKPRTDDLKLQSYSTELHFPARPKTYAGAGLTFFYTGLHDDTYSIRSSALNDSTTAYSLVQEQKQDGEFGSALLLKYGRKVENLKSVGVHVSVGPAVSITNKLKPRLALGAGLTIGNQNCLTIDVGGMFGYSERLSNAYDLKESYTEKPTQTTVSVLRKDYFIGIGYMYRF
jgi:hypothetical protein